MGSPWTKVKKSGQDVQSAHEPEVGWSRSNEMYKDKEPLPVTPEKANVQPQFDSLSEQQKSNYLYDKAMREAVDEEPVPPPAKKYRY